MTEKIGQGTRVVQAKINNLTQQELDNLLSFTAKIQKPSGLVDTVNLGLSYYQNGILSFNYNFSENGNFVVQITLNFTSNITATSEQSIVLDVQSPIVEPAIEPRGNYISKKDLVIYLGDDALTQLSDRSKGQIDDNQKIQQSINDAEALIHSYIASKYNVPALCSDNSVPVFLKQIALHIAVFNMYEKRATTEVIYRYEEAKTQLQHIANNAIVLTCSSGTLTKKTSAASNISVKSVQLKSFCDNKCLN